MINNWQTYGFDHFVGEFYENNRRFLTNANLKSQGRVILELSYSGLDIACGVICRQVKRGETILFSKSPGIQPITYHLARTNQNLTSIVQGMVASILLEQGKNATVCGFDAKPSESPVEYEWIKLGGIEFFTLDPQRLEYLKERFYSIADIQDYPDPFENQP